MSEKTIGILVARMTSSRLPGKSLRKIAGRPVVAYTLERMQQVPGIDEIWLATTEDPHDAPLIAWAQQQGIQTLAYTGNVDDMVGRLTATVNAAKAERFVFALGDCPFIDHELLTRFIQAMDEHSDWEVVGIENHGPSLQRGLGCYRSIGWHKVDAASQTPSTREHLGSILNDRPDLLIAGNIDDKREYYNKKHRLTVDTRADVALIEHIVDALQQPGKIIPFADVVAFMDAHPELDKINGHVRQRLVSDEPNRILFAVQAGGTYGMGHLSRCQALAQALEEYHSVSTTFWLATPDPSIESFLKEQGCNVVDSNWRLPEILRQKPYHRIVIDFQGPIPPTMMREVHSVAPTVPVIVLDNDSPGTLEADLVVIPNAHGQPHADWASHNVPVMQGAEYVILGPGIQNRQILEDGSQFKQPFVLITMGGTDPYGYSEKVLSALLTLENCHIDLIIPPGCPKPEQLEIIATRLPSTITLHWRLSNLKSLMQHASIAIASFGITAYELAYIGVPTLLMSHTEEQLPDLERFAQGGSAINLGWGEAVPQTDILNAVQSLLGDDARKHKMRKAGYNWIDGHGAQRVAALVMAAQPKAVNALP